MVVCRIRFVQTILFYGQSWLFDQRIGSFGDWTMSYIQLVIRKFRNSLLLIRQRRQFNKIILHSSVLSMVKPILIIRP